MSNDGERKTPVYSVILDEKNCQILSYNVRGILRDNTYYYYFSNNNNKRCEKTIPA